VFSVLTRVEDPIQGENHIYSYMSSKCVSRSWLCWNLKQKNKKSTKKSN